MHVGGTIHRLHNLLCRDNNRFPHSALVDSLTNSHGYILCWLADHAGEDIYQRDVEKQLQLRRSSVTQVLQLMERNGLVQRVSVERDARLKKLVLTPRAQQLVQLIRAGIDETERRLTAGIPPQELAAFAGTLGKLRANLERGLFADARAQQQTEQEERE